MNDLLCRNAWFESPLGYISVSATNNSITEVSFLDKKPDADENSEIECIAECVKQLQEYFAGNRKSFNLTLNPAGTDFQKKVWNKLLEIPFGKTTTYLAIAKKLGDEKVIRAAASANGKNPIAIIIPCHRVIGSDGSLVGYAGGLERKQKLLELEQGVFQMKMDVF